MRTKVALSKRLVGLMTVGLIASLLPGFYVPAQAATSCVNPGGTGGCASSIQDAVDAAAPGDTINVAAGDYAESVTVDKALTLNGPNAGVSALGARGPEAIVTSPGQAFSTTANDVVIDGFSASGGSMTVAVGGVPGGTTNDNVVISNNIITATGSNNRAISLIGSGDNVQFLGNNVSSEFRQLHISPLGNTLNDLTIDGNRFSGLAPTGIQFAGSGTIDGFDFTNNEVLAGTVNLGVYLDNADMSGNLFTAAAAPQLQASLHNSTVTGNSFDGGGAGRCLQLFGVQYGLVASNNVTISDNDFANCNLYALQLSEGVDGIDVFHNDFADTVGDAISTRHRFPGDAPGPTGPPSTWTLNSDIHINYNSITGSTGFGVNNTVDGTLDAEYNWWGDPSGPSGEGPGTGDAVSTGVDYDPWWCAPDGSCVSGTAAPGDTVTTEGDAGQPTATDTQTTSVESPNGGPVEIEETDTHDQPLPSGYSFFGQQVNITAPSSPNPNPLVITFKFDASTINPPAPGDVIVRRSGVDVPACSPGNEPSAIPDPCVESQGVDGNGDLEIVVFTTSASPWDFITPVPVACTITGTPGDDELNGTPGDDVICGLGGDDTIRGRGGNDELHGQDGNDTLYGNGGNDLFFGGDGNDDFLGGGGSDEMYGGLGNDRMWGNAAGDEMYGGDGDDKIVGHGGPDTIEGGNGDDDLLAGDGINDIDAGSGDDYVRSGSGPDNIVTGGGDDEIYAGRGLNTVDSGGGNDTVFTGDDADDITTGTDDDYVDSGWGDDTIDTNGGNDAVFSGGGTNTIDTGGGDDYVLTGNGPDTVFGGTDNDKIETGLGDDTVFGDGGNDALYLGNGNNFADAGAGDNYVLGGPGADLILAGSGFDVIDGLGGDNVIDAGDGPNAVFAGDGNNSVVTGSGADYISLGAGADTIFAGDGNDSVYAGRGTNTINGEGGDDYLRGGEDNDAFDGGPGTDTCDGGGLGADTFANCENVVP